VTVQTCPTDVVRAPGQRVWELITTPRLYPLWADSRVTGTFDRPVQPGDRIVLQTGPGHLMRATFVISSVRVPEELALDVLLPFGLVNHEVIRIGRISDGECRVTFS